ncbi:E3 SUMO-protein ligase ZBED1-like [Macrosteles quadrilineatus]|uniref:E3 SUMO-protein ligase ZBED1-like n=1 Tax=Macrosteles quadrilineatus TaxID=74068 RepID=UPI0023E0DE59|nr:E3 SUMO-protein ligase ZBED1-like [Macrosteles quadrilineatus]
MGKKSSIVWNHFTVSEKGGTRATCHHCNKELSYTLSTMSNLGRHMKSKHPEFLGLNKSANESTMEVYEIEANEIIHDEPKSYEISMRSFEEMEDIDEPGQNNESATASEEIVQSTPVVVACSSEKKDRKRSKVWNHYQRSPGNKSATCLHCGKGIKMGTISNLARHVRHVHPDVPFIYTHEQALSYRPSQVLKAGGSNTNKEESKMNNEMDISSEVIELHVDDYQNPENVIETTVPESNLTEDRDVDYGSIAQPSQTETLNITEDFDMHDYIKPKETSTLSEKADRLLVKMIVKGCHPVGMVEQRGFKAFISALNPKYELPSLSKVTNELIPGFYKECESRAVKSLQDAEGICLYLDQWKTKTDSYMCVAAHFINKESKFESLFLMCHVLNPVETVTDISQRLVDSVSEWEVSDKVVAVVTDNSEMMAETVKYNNWVHIPHFMKSLSLIIHENFNIIKNILIKVKNITADLKKTPHAVAEIYSKHKSLGNPPVKLLIKVNNHWNSSFTTLEMLSRFTKLKSAIMHVLPGVSEYNMSESEWRILKHFVEVFEIFKEIKQEFTKEERLCMSKIVFYIKSLNEKMKECQKQIGMPSDIIFVATNTITLLDKHFSDFMGNDLVSLMLMLDPRLKKHAFSDETEYALACSKLKKEVCEVSVPESEYAEPDPMSLWYSFDQEVIKLNGVKDPIGKGILEFENYLQEQLLERDKDPLIWWDNRKAIYPRLYKLVRKYLCVTNKLYTHKDSISKKTAYMLSQLRNCESNVSQSQMMFLHHNM